MPYAERSHGCGSNHERSTWGCREDRLHEDWNSSSFSGVGGFCDRGRIDEVLGNPEYRQNAMRFKRIIAETDGLARAAQMLENAFDLKPENLSDASQNPV